MGFRYAILGAGRQGISAGYDLGRLGSADEIRVFDIDTEAAQTGADRINRLLGRTQAGGAQLDARNEESLRKSLEGVDSVISALPFELNLSATRAALAVKANFCDLGGHTETVRAQLKLDEQAKLAGVTLTPDCGMAPGLNISMVVLAMSMMESPEEIFVFDGGLPQTPKGPWNYRCNFHINGLTNEYDGEAIFLRNGKVTPVPTLTEQETVTFDEPLGTLEARVTSGGLSTAPWAFEGQLKTLENKTLRYPGHWREFRAFKDLGLFSQDPVMVKGSRIVPRDFYHTLLKSQIYEENVPDICAIRVLCKGKNDGQPLAVTLDLVETEDKTTGLTAMEKLTGWHASIIAILAAQNKIPRGGVPVDRALSGPDLQNQAALRHWNIRTLTEKFF